MGTKTRLRMHAAGLRASRPTRYLRAGAMLSYGLLWPQRGKSPQEARNG